MWSRKTVSPNCPTSGRRVEDAYRGEAVKAFVVLKEDHRQRISPADLLSFCQERLMPYKVPRFIEFREALPLSAAGKMLRRMLRNGAEPPR